VPEGQRERPKIVPRFDEEDDELVGLVKEYEKYAKSSHGSVEDFDEWLELEYGKSKSKVMKPSKKNRNQMKGATD
jgi:hypothetical protein